MIFMQVDTFSESRKVKFVWPWLGREGLRVALAVNASSVWSVSEINSKFTVQVSIL